MTEFHGEMVKAPRCDHPWTYHYTVGDGHWICLKCNHKGYLPWQRATVVVVLWVILGILFLRSAAHLIFYALPAY